MSTLPKGGGKRGVPVDKKALTRKGAVAALQFRKGKTVKMKIVIIIAAMVLVSSASGSPMRIYINDVDITPQVPTMLDIINIDILGGAAHAGSQVEYREFSQNGTSLQLDLFVLVGPLTIPSSWSHLEQVGPFDAESYSLTVRALEYQDGTLKDTYTVDFTVVPEPATFVLFGLGGLFLRKRR